MDQLMTDEGQNTATKHQGTGSCTPVTVRAKQLSHSVCQFLALTVGRTQTLTAIVFTNTILVHILYWLQYIFHRKKCAGGLNGRLDDYLIGSPGEKYLFSVCNL